MEIVADYQALQGRAALGGIAPRGQIAVAGKDRAGYLQGLLTNDVQALMAGTGCYAAWLTPQGRMLTDMHVLESGEMILLDVPAELVEETLQRLDQFLFSEDVQLGDLRSTLEGVWLHGPGAAATIEGAVSGVSGLAAFASHQNARATFDGAPVVIARIDQLGVPGYCVFIEPARSADFSARLRDAGAVDASTAAIEAARIEAGTPVFGVDMDTETIPLEAGIEAQAISFTKGCYVGQEVIIRVMHRGHGRVAKKLVGLRVERGPSPARNAKVFAGEREIGRITSVAMSPRLGAIALGYVHRDFVEPGTRVDVDAAGARVGATVSARPMTSGPG